VRSWRKTIIRTLFQSEQGSDYIGLVRLKGLEPARIAAREPKSRMSTNSITGAYIKAIYYCMIAHQPDSCQRKV
jgi:hypothetical protein